MQSGTLTIKLRYVLLKLYGNICLSEIIWAVRSEKELDTLDRFYAISAKGDNFCDFLFSFQYTKSLLKKGSTLKGKNLLPRGANSFLLDWTPFQTREHILCF